ncbi:butyrate kinase [Natroniella sulfidigena]|uniref:butyrate kinase n=1 Tax=Natroniella sulfidigena TaxID=723921 RepID=UPI00200B99BB|nr:butyrate kinase [Natroniella sulfidigena]MCK8817284.1 butyrate kinase [Natroniella sulfidigena]
MKKFRILTINPGSTSTKLAIYHHQESELEFNLEHDPIQLKNFDKTIEQFRFRKEVILTALQKEGIDLENIDAISARGGLLKPLVGGTYIINQQMLTDLKAGSYGEHASNLGALIAQEIAKEYDIPAYIVDPVVVDEFEDIARVSGHPEFERKSVFHALNQKAMARKAADELRANYQELNLIVAHLGGGISIGAHKQGRVVDVNNALDGEGPFTPARSGTLPTGDLMRLSSSGEYSPTELYKMIVGQGGLTAYCGTSNVKEIEEMIDNGDQEADLYYRAMAYQVAKWIGAASTVLKGQIDSIVITGGIAYSKKFTVLIKERVEFLAPVKIYPGENELKALAEGAWRVLSGREEAKIYK